MKRILFMLLLSLGVLSMQAQLRPVAQSDSSVRQAEYRSNIGIDMSVPDFDTKKIDAKIMGSRLAGILNYLLENYNQGGGIQDNLHICKKSRMRLWKIFISILRR